ncbi:GAF domain-containing protein, partial [Streptomyces sp. S399]|uniref:GAF domain-containing protein n=1 Tax=Streptomyces sp. S399 TaxID=3096009 RepID=UPI002A7EDCE5
MDMTHDGPHPTPGTLASPGAEAPFLELLARGATVEAYEEPVPAAREAGACEAHLAALEHAKRLALRVRSELADRRRREAELSALFETAHDLAGPRDLDSVLQAIVQRARSLLGTDVAYLTLNDPARGDTFMRVTEGSVAARFQQLRLGMGEGLGGLVAQTARPYVTEDYFHDSRFQHTSVIDTGVQDEGLVAILGVPLMLGPHVIGVLFAADRRARVFERAQTALLGSFAALAAAAIESADLLDGTRAALSELEHAHEIIQDRSAVIERASDVHDRLAELVLRGGGVHDVAAAVSEVLDGSVEFIDTVPEAAAGALRSDGHAVRHGDDWIAAVAAGDQQLGGLVLRGHPALDPVDQRTFERAAMVTSLLLLARRSAGDAEQRVQDGIDLAEVLIEQALEHQDGDEARHGIGQEEQGAVGGAKAHAFPIQQHGKEHADGRRTQHRQRRERHRPAEDGQEGPAELGVPQHAGVVARADEGLEGRNRVLVVALAVLRIAKPEADRVGVAA